MDDPNWETHHDWSPPPPPSCPVIFLHLPLPASSSFFLLLYILLCFRALPSFLLSPSSSHFLLAAHLSFPPACLLSLLIPALFFFCFFASSWMFTSCRPHHPFWLGVCWEDLLLSLAFYLFPYLLFPLKMKLKSPALTHANVRAHRHHSAPRRTRRPTKTTPHRAEAYERARTSRPTFALPSSHPSLSVLASTFSASS